MSFLSPPPVNGVQTFAARRFVGDEIVEREEAIAVEAPVALTFNGHTFAVMMATPLDLEDFARGFALTEGIIDHVGQIKAIEAEPVERGFEVHVQIPEAYALALRARQRALSGNSGCGVCGVDSISQALRPVAPVDAATRVAPSALRAAAGDLAGRQQLNARVGAAHAAAFADLDGAIRLVREDVGRHNALDKLLGALTPAGLKPDAGFVLMSSRCAHELVHKVAMASVAVIAAISAPTSLAIERAERADIGLVGFAREGRFTVYASPWRIGEG